jgi:hypothetical protein
VPMRSDGSVTTAQANQAKQQIAAQFPGHVGAKVYNQVAVLASSLFRGRAFAGIDARRKRTGRPQISISLFHSPSPGGWRSAQKGTQ